MRVVAPQKLEYTLFEYIAHLNDVRCIRECYDVIAKVHECIIVVGVRCDVQLRHLVICNNREIRVLELQGYINDLDIDAIL